MVVIYIVGGILVFQYLIESKLHDVCEYIRTYESTEPGIEHFWILEYVMHYKGEVLL
jgi:hypothetical protein